MSVRPCPGRRTGNRRLPDRRHERADRVPPAPRRIARRRFFINLTKWVLPLFAMALLSLIALWPEIDQATLRRALP